MPLLDLEALRATPLKRQPFDYLIVPGFIRREALPALHADYPRIDSAGSFPLGDLSFGPAFRALVETLRGREVEAAFADKFGIDLRGRPTMVTVRGRCDNRDGNIHTDSLSKLITVLLYMNAGWEEASGRLRLLRSAHDLEDVIVEVPPVEGTLVAFRRSHNSWHGHKPFIGVRRVVQLNWVVNRRTAFRETFRHRLSAWVKRLGALVWPPARTAAKMG